MSKHYRQSIEAAHARFTLVEALTALHRYNPFNEVPKGTEKEVREAQRLAALVVDEAALKDLWDVITNPEAPAAARYQVVVQLLQEGNDHYDGEALNDLAPQLEELKSHVLA